MATTLETLVIEYAMKLDSVERGTQKLLSLLDKVDSASSKGPSKLADSFDKAGKSAMSLASSTEKLTTAQAKAAVAASKVGVAEAQAAQAIKKADDAASKGNKSAQDLALAQAKAALAADKVKLAQAQAAAALYKATTGMGKQKAVASSAGQAINRMEAETKKFSNATSSAISKINSFASSLSKVKSAAATAKSSVSSLGMSMLDFGNKLGGTIGAVQSLASGAMDLGKSLLAPAFNAEQTSIAFKQLLGSEEAAAKMMQQLNTLAIKTPFELPEIQDGAKQLLAFKFAGDDIPSMLTRIGDAAFTTGKGAEGMQRIIMALGQMKLKGKVSGEEMLQLTEANVGAWDYLAKAMNKTTGEVQAMASKGLIPADEAIKIIIEGMKEFDGAMENASKSGLGMFSSMKDAFNMNILKSFGDGLLEPLKGVMGELTVMFQNPEFQKFAAMLGEQIGGGINNLVGFFKEASKWVDTFMTSANGVGLVNLVHSFEDLGRTLNFGPALETISKLLAQFFSKEGAIEGGMAVNDAFNGIATAVNFLSDAIKSGQDAWTNIQPVLEKVGAFLTETFAPVWDQLVTTFNDQIIPAWDDLVAGIEPIMPQLEIVGVLIAGLATGILGGLMGALSSMLQGVIQFVGGVIEWISGLVQFWTGAIAFIVAFVMMDFEGMGKALETMMGGIGRMFQGAWEMIQGIWKFFIGSIQGYIDGFVKGIVGFFTWLWDELVGHSIIPDMIDGIIKWFQDLGPNAMKAVEEFVNNVKKAIEDFAKNCYDLGKSIIDNIVNGIKSLAGNIGEAIKTVVRNAAATFGITIPGFAAGVENFSGGLAMVGERGPELVYLPKGSSVYPMSSSPTPSRSGGSLAMSGGGGSQNMVVVLELDGDVIGQYAAEYMDKKVRLKFGSGARGRG